MERLRTFAEVAAELGISTRTLKRRVAEARIRPARVGRAPLLSDADIEKVLYESRWREPGNKNLPQRLRDPAETARLRQLERQRIRSIIDGVAKEWRKAK